MAALRSEPAETLLAGERQILEMICTGKDLPTVLDALCRLIDDQLGQMSMVYVLDRHGRQMRLGAAPHVPDVFRRAARTILAGRTSGSCGAAVASRAPVVVDDVEASPLYGLWRDAVREGHIKAAWSTPFFSSEGETLGTFAILRHERGSPAASQMDVVARATHLACVAVEHDLIQRSLRESERRFSRVFYLNPLCMAISEHVGGRLLYVNDAFTRMFGYTRADAVGRTVVELGLYADPSDRTRLIELVGEGHLHDIETRARTKSGDIIDISLSMERIELLGEERLVLIAADITERKRAEKQLRASEKLLRQVLDASPVGVTVMDGEGNVILTNPAATRIWGEMFESGRERYTRTVAGWHATGKRVEPDEWASVRAVRNGETSVNEMIDIDSFDGVRKIMRNSAVPICDASGSIIGAVVVNEDVTAAQAAERERDATLDQLRALTTRLMRAQEDERRRIAQMLHETTAQDLAGLKMLLGGLQRGSHTLEKADRTLLGESIELADRSIAGIRTLSYLLYPPFLDETGLLSALRWYAAGFSERSGIAVTLDLPATLERLPQDIENALYRVVQEALINIHRHSGSPTARITLQVEGADLALEIQDAGRGIPSDMLAPLNQGSRLGVGIAGMRERLAQFGGTLDVESGGWGTALRVRVPFERQAP